MTSNETCERCGRIFKNTHGLNIHRTRTHGDPFAHGVSGYTNHRCRCAECRDAWCVHEAEQRLIRVERPIPPNVVHGRASTYRNYSCRCEPCRQANTAATAAYRLRKQADA